MAEPAAAPDTDARDEVLRRLHDLPYLDQIEVLRALSSWVQASELAESPIVRQVAERVRALEDLKRAAAWLKLAEGEAPTVAQYREARAALGLELSSGQVIRRWERWRTACNALTGRGFVARTQAQRALRDVGMGRRRGTEDFVTALRAWQDQPDMPLSRRSYIAWSESATEEREKVGERPLPSPSSITTGLALSWELAQRVATRELGVAQAQKLYLQQLIRESGPLELLPMSAVAIMFKTTGKRAPRLTKEPGFPPPAARIGGGPCWYRADLEARRNGFDVTDREQGEAQRLIYSSAEVGRRLGLTSLQVATNVSHQSWHLTPPPAGRVSIYWYWLREDFDRWKKARDRRLARERRARTA